MEKYPHMFSRQQYFSHDVSRKVLRTNLYRLAGISVGIFTLYFLVYQKLPNFPVLGLMLGALFFNVGFLILHPQSGFQWRYTKNFTKYLNMRYRFYLASSNQIETPAKKSRDSILLTKGNIVFVQNVQEIDLMAVWGLTLRSTAIQIQPNIPDFLRRIYEIPAFVPINVQLTLSANPVQFSYTLFFGRSLGTTKGNVIHLLSKVGELEQDLITALEINFPHFHFARLEGAELIRGITGRIGGSSEPIIQPKVVKFTPMVVSAVGGFLFLCLINFCIWFGLGLAVKDSAVGVYLSSLIFLIGCLGVTGWKLQRLFFFNGGSKHQILPIELFPHSNFYRASHNTHLHIFNQSSQQLTVSKMYTLGALNRHFRFNRTKFYRSLLSQVTSHHVGITLNFYLRRVVEQSLPMFQNVFTPKFWRQWENLPDRRDGVARNVCGFFKFQVLFTTFKVIEKSFNEIEPQDIISVRYELDKIFLPIFRQGFSHCQPKEVSAKNMWQYLSKATDVFSKGHLPIFFSTGAQLSSFVAIPDEIHKVLPLIYPSEFATPLLNDDFEFGSTLNSENHQLESPGGLKTNEINQNILVCGDHQKDVQNAVQQIVFSLLDHDIPMVIFDWNGTWSTPVGHYLTDHPTQRIEYFKIGQDVGISLFSLPKKKLNPHIPGNIEIAYMTDIIRTFRLIYRWSDAEIALLQTVLGNASNLSIPMILADIKSFLEKNSHKSAVSALLLMLGKDFLKTIFDAPLSPQFVVETWHNRDASIIINLQPLKDPQLKHLFVRLFLTQLLYTKEYFTIPDELLFPKSVVLPILHNLWDERIGKGYLDSAFPLMTRMIKANHPLIASSHIIERVHPGVFGMFKSSFALRVQSPRSLKIMSDILHLDDFYTNSSSSHGSNRHRSYQRRLLLHMDHNQALVVRPTQSFPYIFQFYQKVSMKPCTFPELLKCSQLMTPVYIQETVTTIKISATPLERDFTNHGNLIPILYNLLTTIKEKQKILEIITRSQLNMDLFAFMAPIFQESTLTPHAKQKLCETIIQQLIDQNYLLPKVIGTNRSTQQEGFELGLVAVDSLVQHNLTVDKNQAQQEKITEEKNRELKDAPLTISVDNPNEDRSLEIPHQTFSPEFIDGTQSLLTRLTTMFIFGTSRWKNEGIAASYWQMHMDLTNVEEHLDPLTDKYSVMVLDALQQFHRKLEENPPEKLTDAQYGALLAEYEIIPMRLR